MAGRGTDDRGEIGASDVGSGAAVGTRRPVDLGQSPEGTSDRAGRIMTSNPMRGIVLHTSDVTSSQCS